MPKSLSELYIDKETSVAACSQSTPLVFLLVRHNGCTYCRKSLSALRDALPQIIETGVRPFVVHMGTEEQSPEIASEYALKSVSIIADPQKEFYQTFGARRGSLKEVIGPAVIAKGLLSGDLLKHGVGSVKSDPYQLGGAYLVNQSRATPLHIPKNTSDTENWGDIVSRLPEG